MIELVVKFSSLFITDNNRSYNIIKNFITHDMKVHKIEVWDYWDKRIIAVPEDKFDELLTHSQQYIVNNQINGIKWIDYYANDVDINYLIMAKCYLDDIYQNDKEKIKICKNYFDTFQNNTGIETIQEYNQYNNNFSIMFKNIDYNQNLELLNLYFSNYPPTIFDSIYQTMLNGKESEKVIYKKLVK